jgi:hypothetical protein
MANKEHLRILTKGVAVWNKWREDNPNEIPDMVQADLSGVNLRGANLRGANLRGANLGVAFRRSANLSDSNLTGADLKGANLKGADLRSANLRIAYLSRADLRGASFDYADISHADLIEADLSSATLTGTNLTGAKMAGTILTDARFRGTILGGLDLSSVVGLETAVHQGPSSLGVDTLYKSRGLIPEVFLRGAGLPETLIEYLPALLEQPIQFYSVFISYSHKDKAFAKRLYDALQGRGIRCWLDEHQLLPGDKIAQGIDQGIRLWDKVLLCCSKDSLNSWWVKNEVNLAIQKEQRLYDKEKGREVLSLIPLNLDGYMFNEEWRSEWKGQITSRLALDFTNWEYDNPKFEEQLERVVKALRADAGARGVVPPSRL